VDTTPFRVLVQIPGTARRMEAGAFRAALDRASRLHLLLSRYLHAFLTHVGQSVACNGRHSVEQRCCRWLLAARDRVGEDSFPLTQEFLASMLGVRRTGVTEVAGRLQRAGLIRYSRGRVSLPLSPCRHEPALVPPCFVHGPWYGRVCLSRGQISGRTSRP
jgi:CRP-like cAMP-binding protein